MRKVLIRFSIFAAIFLSLYASRHFFIGTALEYGIKRATGSSLSYNSRYWEGSRLYYEGFSLGEQLYTEQAAFEFKFHLFPLSVHAAIHLNAPTIQLNDSQSQSNFVFLIPTQFSTVKLDIKKGTLLSTEKKLCLFDFSSGFEKEQIGKLTVYQEDGAPLLSCGFNYQDGNLSADFQMDEAPLAQTLPLAALIYPLPVWKVLEGTASAAIQGSLNVEKVTALKGHVSLQNVHLESDDLIFAADKADSTIDFQGDFEAFALDTDFKGVDLFWKELEVLRGEGAIVFKPKKTPTFEVHAAVHLADLEGRADIVGKGEIQNNHSMWLEGTFDYVTATNPLRIEFTWADDGSSQVLQTQIHNLGKEILSFLKFPFSIKQGIVNGQATAYLDQGMFERLQLDNIRIHQLVIDNLRVQEAEVQGSLNLLSGDIEQLTVQARDIEGEVQGWKVSQAEVAISILDNNFEPSSAFGKFEQIPFALELQGPLSSFHASAKLSGGASEWLKLPKNNQELPVILDLVFDRNQDDLQIRGTLACLEDTVELNAQAYLSSAVLKGGFQGSRLQSSFYAPFLKIFAPSIQMQGDLSLRGQFTNKTIDILAQGEDLLITSPDFQLSVYGQSREVLYHFDLSEKLGSGKAKLSPMLLTTPKFDQPISITTGDLVFDNHSLLCQGLKGEISEIDIQGDLSAKWEEKMEVHFSSQKIEGSLENLLALAAPFYKIPVELKGRFTCAAEGMQFHFANGQTHYQLKTLLDEIEGALTPDLHLKNTSCQFVFDSLDNQLMLQNITGTLSEEFTFSAQEIRYQKGEWNFDAALSQGDSSLLSLKGRALESALGYRVTLHEAKASSSYLKSPLSFHWSPPSHIDQVQGVVYIDTVNLAQQLDVLDQLGLFRISSGIRETLSQLKGGLTLKMTVSDDHSDFEIQGSDVRYASTVFNTLAAHLVQEGNQWILKHCALDDVRINGEAVFQNSKWVVSACDLDWKGLKIHTAGIFEQDRFDFKVEGQLNSRFALQGNGSFLSSSPQLQNLSIKFQDNTEPLASFSADKIVYADGKWESPAVDVMVISKQLSVPLHAQLKLSHSFKSTTFQGSASQGEVKLEEGVLKLTQIYGLYEASYLNLKCVAKLGDEPLHMVAKLSKDRQFGGSVNIQQGKELLKLTLSDPATCQTAEGELFGLTVDLKKEDDGFKGTLLLNNGVKLAELTGNESFNDFSGLLLSGLFTKETFKGEVEGHEARLKEYLVQELHASVDYTPTRFRIKNLTLQDPAGSFAVKECNGFRSATLDKWNVTIPLIKGQEIKPSAFRKLGTSQKEIKPLQIRFLVMTDILGQLGDLSSFRGLGKFNFSQRVKKEPSLFDIPLALLKDFGLDLDIFSPVMGEVEMQLRDGKLFFTDLQNTFSEGKRSEFYLAVEPSYIDLKGGLFLNLRMQQNVVLKLVEPFMVAVRGTWEKPKYSLQ